LTETYAGYRPRPRAPGTSARYLISPPPQRLYDRAVAGLAEDFVGITTDGHALPDLFPVRQTGASTEPMLRAAKAYLETLSPEQRASAVFDVGDLRTWRSWSNVHPFLIRHGVGFEQMSPEQSEAALNLLRASLSADGYQTARDVMRLNDFIGIITGRPEEYGEWVYWLSIMGSPSTSDPWGWQIDGHHLNINCFVLGDQVVMTPMFMGSEPVSAETGKYAGTRVFAAEEADGLALMQALPSRLRDRATIGMEFPASAAGFTDNLVIPYAGVRYDELPAEGQARLTDLMSLYLGRMRPDYAQVRMDEVRQHLAETYFAWAGECADDSVFYYRVQSPVILIEFDHQAGIALDSDVPTRTHIHTIVRTPNGNDYGADLLRQHYQRFDHSGGGHRPTGA